MALRVAAACGVIAPIAYTLLWIVFGRLEAHYDNLRQDVSDFGALTATHPAPYNIIVVLTGVLVLVFGAGLFAAIGRPLLARAGCAVVLLLGVCQVLDGIFREDCSPSGNPFCRSALDAGALSWHHRAHDLESLLWFASAVAAPLILALAFRRLSGWTWLMPPLLTAAAAAAIAAVWSSSTSRTTAAPTAGCWSAHSP